LPTRADAAMATRRIRNRRVRVSHVCSRSRVCSRQASARAHDEEAAMGSLRSVSNRVPSKCTTCRPTGKGPASGECACAGGGRCCPEPVPPVPPWSSVVPSTAPLVGIFPGNPSTPGGHGHQARHPAGQHRLISASSGGGTPTTAGSPIPSVRPPRGAFTPTLGRATCRMGGWKLGAGAAIGGVRLRL